MFELSKRKRMMIMEQLTSKRDRLPSAERRKLAEKQYNQFIKTMNNLRPIQESAVNLSDNNSRASEFKKSDLLEKMHLDYSPTVNDIPKPPTDRNDLQSQFYETERPQKIQPSVTSPPKLNNVNFYQPDSFKKQKPEIVDDLNRMKEQTSQQQSEAKIEDEEINIPYINPSIPPSSANNSEAIFFTSEFKNYIERQPSQEQEKKQNVIEPIKEVTIQKPQQAINENDEHRQEIIRHEQTLKSNRSGQSLVLSNDSSLKFSLAQSAVHQAIAKKLTHELVVQSLGDSKMILTFKKMAMLLVMKENSYDIIQFGKQEIIKRETIKNQKKRFFFELMLKKQLKYQLRKEKIKIEQFREEQQQKIAKECFYQWKVLQQQKTESVSEFIERRNTEILGNTFRALKMLLYDRKINSQIDLFYLSKLFYAFKNSVEKESKRQLQKAYRFYFKNLKKRMFSSFIEGIQNVTSERLHIQMAEDNYCFNLMRKGFDSWKQTMPFEDRYVKLQMTTSIELRQTEDKRLIQTKTFDFREIG